MLTLLRSLAFIGAALPVAACGSGFTSASSTDGGGTADGAGSPEAAPRHVIPCGGTACDLGSHTCCIGTGDPPNTACENGPSCKSSNNLAAHCASRADCPVGQVCCLSQQSTTTTSCTTQCQGGDVQVCNPQKQNTCSGGQQCNGGQGGFHLPSNIGTCGN